MTTAFNPDLKKLRSELRQAKLAYDACIAAMQNGDRDKAVKLQLLAIDSLNEFNNQLLEDLEHMRKPPRKVWAP